MHKVLLSQCVAQNERATDALLGRFGPYAEVHMRSTLEAIAARIAMNGDRDRDHVLAVAIDCDENIADELNDVNLLAVTYLEFCQDSIRQLLQKHLYPWLSVFTAHPVVMLKWCDDRGGFWV